MNQINYPQLQTAATTGTVTVPPGSYGISLTTGTVDGKNTVIAFITNNTTSGNQTIPIQQGLYYYVDTIPSGKNVHMVVDIDTTPTVIDDQFTNDAYPGRGIFYNTIIDLNA